MAVRRERIILDVEDNATAKFARAAAGAELLNRSVNKLGGTSTSASREVDKTTASTDRLGTSSRKSGSDLNNYTGRLGALADAAIILGPALVPLGAATIPALTASLAGLGAAAGGIGATVLAFQGVGDAVKAINAYNLDPTVANLKKMHEAVRQLGPDAREFAKFTADLEPNLKQLQSIAAAGVFPGLEAGITDLLTRLPLVQEVVSRLAHGMGDLASKAGSALASDEFTPFFNYLKSDAEPTLIAFATATGNVVETVANLFVAFAPLNRDFTGGLVGATQAMANWSKGLDKNTSFQNFLDYLRTNGPRAVALLGSLAKTFGSIVEASAPIGANILPVLTELSNIVGIIARSDIGTPLLGGLVALRLYGRAAQGIALAQKEMIGLGFASKTTGVSLQSTATGLKRIAASPGGIAAVAGAVTLLGNALADATGAKIKTDDLQRNLESLANGKNSELLKRINNDLGITGDTIGKIAEPIHEAVTAFGLFGNTGMDNAADNIHQIDEALAQMVESGNGAEAAKIFDQILASVSGGIPGASHSKAEIDGLMKSFGAYGTALGNVKPAADDASGAVDGLTGAVTGNRSAQQQLAASINQANQAMKAQRDAALAAFDAETQYRQAVKDAAAQAKKSSDGIRGSTDAALANRSALSGLAGAWNNQSAAVKNNVGRYKEARANFIQTAEAMKVPQARAKALADQLLDIPRSVVTKVKADTAAAEAAVARVGADLRNLHDRTVYIRVHTVHDGGDAGVADMHGGSGYASGGYTGRGGKYEVAGVVHREELVLPREIVKRDLQYLKARYSGLPGFAGGGLVGSARTAPTGGGFSDVIYQLGHFGDAAAGGLKALKAQLDEVNKAYDKQKQALSDLRSTMADLASTVSGRFAVDLSGSSSSNGASVSTLIQAGLDPATAAAIYANSNPASDPLSAIASATAQAGQMSAVIRTLKKWGLSGPALAQILSQMSLADLQALVAAGPGQAQAYQSALNGLYSAQASVGGAAASAAYGSQESAMAKAQRALHAQVVELTQEIKVLQKHQKETTVAAGQTGPNVILGGLKGAGVRAGQRRAAGG